MDEKLREQTAVLPGMKGLTVAYPGGEIHLYRDGQRIDIATKEEIVNLYGQLKMLLQALHEPIAR